MTISEAILSFPGLEDVPANFLEKTLIVRSLNGSDSYSKEIDKQVNLAAADLYVFIVNQPDFTENKLSMTYPRKYYINTAVRLYLAGGEMDNANKVNGKKITVQGKATSKW